MSLKEYNRKRRFDETPEPEGEIKQGSGDLTFVVQMHDATRLHYDFRLEMGGVFQSWAVPKGPSLNPNDQRLAVHVEDHPLDYGDFEGVIPKGNYGAGTVMIWDRGTFVERGSKGREDSEAALAKGLAKGHITFVLSGQKLGGEFALVQLEKDKGGKAWLLLKKRDEYASYSADVTKEDKSAATGRSMDEITLQAPAKNEIWLPGSGPKDPQTLKRRLEDEARAKPRRSNKGLAAKPPEEGAEAAELGDCPDESLPRKLKPMLFAEMAADPEGEGWLNEPRLDGVRALAEVEGMKVKLHSKAFLPFEKKYPRIVDALKTKERRYVLDGEIVGRGEDAVYHVFDLLHLDGKNTRVLPLRVRKRLLSGLGAFPEDGVVHLVPHAVDDPAAGRVVRHGEAPYKSGTSPYWLKLREGEAQTSVVLTNLDKVFWPKEGYTKGDVVAYYRAVAKTILPHLMGRPESMNRHPNGIDKEGFFQKDVSGYLPSFVRTTRVESGSSGRSIDYLICDNEETLLYMANLGCIELNPWFSRVGSLERPDYCVIDLDPGKQPFSVVVQTALEVKDVIDRIGIPSFPKTSGGSGLHICLPLGARVSFDDSRMLAEAICRIVEKRLPDLTTLERQPGHRHGRLYLDCLQNRRGQTLAAPYCLRPRPGAPASAPLRWSEVKQGLSPQSFNIKTMPARIEEIGDLFLPIYGEAIDVAAALSRISAILS